MLLNLILFKAADSSRGIYEVAMQLLQVCKQMLIKKFFIQDLMKCNYLFLPWKYTNIQLYF